MLVPVLLLLLLQKGTQKQATTKKAAPKKSSSGASQWVSSSLWLGWVDGYGHFLMHPAGSAPACLLC